MCAQPSISSEARVPTSLPPRYLAQLGKHFRHRRAVVLAEDHGRIEFPGGVCVLEAEAEVLVLRVNAEDETALAMLEEVVAQHLVRFAFRKTPEIRWERTGGSRPIG